MPISNCLFCNKEIKYNPSQSTGKYCSNKCQQEYRYKNITVPNIEAGVTKDIRSLRRYITEARGNTCSECGLHAMWNNKPLKLHLDHIDGDRKNNRIDNLRLLCPNCHTQTSTYAGRNNKNAVNQYMLKVGDAELKKALDSNENIHQALAEVGLAITGPNYKRCYKLMDIVK